MPDGFFYGLFMDERRLTAIGLKPIVHGRAMLRDYELHIGDRATLIPKTGGVSYGMLIQLSVEALDSLYSDKSVSEYKAETVLVEMLETGERREAQCYLLAQDKLNATTNADYAATLRSLMIELGLPSS